MSDRRQREDPLDTWVPKTKLGRMVQEGQISSIYEVFEEGYRIKEVPVTWVEDTDTRVDIIKTAREDIGGLLRLRFRPLPKTMKLE